MEVAFEGLGEEVVMLVVLKGYCGRVMRGAAAVAVLGAEGYQSGCVVVYFRLVWKEQQNAATHRRRGRVPV